MDGSNALLELAQQEPERRACLAHLSNIEEPSIITKFSSPEGTHEQRNESDLEQDNKASSHLRGTDNTTKEDAPLHLLDITGQLRALSQLSELEEQTAGSASNDAPHQGTISLQPNDAYGHDRYSREASTSSFTSVIMPSAKKDSARDAASSIYSRPTSPDFDLNVNKTNISSLSTHDGLTDLQALFADWPGNSGKAKNFSNAKKYTNHYK